jgi:hypothetical protein
MTAVTFVPPEVEEYLAAVRAALADLPSLERDDLLAEVEPSLVEAAEESSGPIAARLGPPEAFAAELRAAAGLHEQDPPPRRESHLARRLRALAAHRLARRPLGLAAELAPIWWVARAYLLVGFAAQVFHTGWSVRYPFIPQLGDGKTGFAAILAAAAASVWIGLMLRRRGSAFPRAAGLVNLALLATAISVVPAVTRTSVTTAPIVIQSSAPSGLLYDGVQVDNIYPYSRDGRLLHDVLLYDGAGRPLDLGAQGDPNRRVVRTKGNVALLNVFPIRYFEPGTGVVAHPNAGPPVRVPTVVTPPLVAKKR